MAMTLEQISKLDTARKTGQPQDMAAMLALLMGGQNPLSPTQSQNVGSDIGVGGINVGTPLGTTPSGLGTGQDSDISRLVELLSGGPGGAEPNAPTSAPGPGPNTADAMAQAFLDAITAVGPGGQGQGPGQGPGGTGGTGTGPGGGPSGPGGTGTAGGGRPDPSQIANDMISQNQQEASLAGKIAAALGFVSNPVAAAVTTGGRALGGALGGRGGADVGGLAGKGAGAALGMLGYAPTIPGINMPVQIAQLALQMLARSNTAENARVTGRGLDPNTTGFLEANITNAGPIGIPGGVPGGTPGGIGGGDGGIGVPGTGGVPSSPDVGPAPTGEVGLGPGSSFTGNPTGPEAAPSPSFTGGEMTIGLSPAGPTSADEGDEGEGPETPSGQGSAGDSGGGPGSVLANFATGGKPPQQFFTFYDRFMEGHPRDGKKLFTAYQTVAKQVIARAKAKGREGELADRVYSDFIDPINRYIDDDEVDLATDALVRTTKDLAKEYNVPIPDRYDAVLKRNGGGQRGSI